MFSDLHQIRNRYLGGGMYWGVNSQSRSPMAVSRRRSYVLVSKPNKCKECMGATNNRVATSICRLSVCQRIHVVAICLILTGKLLWQICLSFSCGQLLVLLLQLLHWHPLDAR